MQNIPAHALRVAAALLLVACSEPTAAESGFGGLPPDVATSGDGGSDGAPSLGESTSDGGSDDAAADETGVDPDDTGDGPGPTAMACVYPSTTFGGPMQPLDIMDDPDSAFRLSFTVPGMPDPTQVSAATLRFDSYDADHPGEEGRVYVNGSGPLDLPANVAWDNADGTGEIDVGAYLVAGSNLIEFGPGPLDRSFFHIGNVELLATATVDDCEEASDTGDGGGMGVEQTVHYSDADYTGRNNWVWRCQAGFDYAFTAASDEHIPTDCEGLYNPDGSAHGTATFHFPDVVEDDYLVEVHAYHTWNRNPAGATVIVDGSSGVVMQRTSMEGESSFETAEWGVIHLSGDVDIVMDSSQGGYASDAVSWIRITPQ